MQVQGQGHPPDSFLACGGGHHQGQWDPSRTRRVQMPAIGVDEMLNLEWRGPDNERTKGNPQAGHVYPQMVPAQHVPPQQTMDKLALNIEQIRDSIRDLEQERSSTNTASDPLLLVSDALLSLTKGQKRARESEENKPVNDKKKERMQRNRQSAHESRERKRVYTEQLEGEVKKLSEKNSEFKITIEEMKKTLRALEVEKHELTRT
eukprot:TRINITY_DN198_c0_g1_i1.p1 TRINITY_DN198_c0_g1~~TRINITY_DN198_c0_g1_i1.p1  ORF type:complete len:206 (-),score=44.62 TRINITY_DN198_c0_g1_i1:151-768(-)